MAADDNPMGIGGPPNQPPVANHVPVAPMPPNGIVGAARPQQPVGLPQQPGPQNVGYFAPFQPPVVLPNNMQRPQRRNTPVPADVYDTVFGRLNEHHRDLVELLASSEREGSHLRQLLLTQQDEHAVDLAHQTLEYQDQINNLNIEIQSHVTEIQLYMRERDQATGANAELQQNLDNLIAEHEKAQQELKKALAEVQELRRKNDAKRYDELREKNSAVEKEKSDMAKEIDQLKVDLKDAKCDAAECDNLRRAKHDLTKELEAEKETLAKYRKSSERSEERHERAARSI